MTSRLQEAAEGGPQDRESRWKRDHYPVYSRQVSNRLTIRVTLPASRGARRRRRPSSPVWGQVETTLLVDGRDLVGDMFDMGPKTDPDDLLGPHGLLRPGTGPRRVKLAEAECTEGCCGAVWVQIRYDGDDVVWDSWEDTGGPTTEQGVYRFDAEEYLAELARADNDRGWEWPGRTLARRLRTALQEDPAILARWNGRLDWIVCRPNERGLIHLSVITPADSGTQSLVRLPVTGDPVTEQAERALDRLRRHRPW